MKLTRNLHQWPHRRLCVCMYQVNSHLFRREQIITSRRMYLLTAFQREHGVHVRDLGKKGIILKRWPERLFMNTHTNRNVNATLIKYFNFFCSIVRKILVILSTHENLWNSVIACCVHFCPGFGCEAATPCNFLPNAEHECGIYQTCATHFKGLQCAHSKTWTPVYHTFFRTSNI
jgi:hypothetical protein